MQVLYRHAAVAAGTSPDLVLSQSVLVTNGRIDWMGHDDQAPDPSDETRVVDAGGTTLVPGLVDAHSHFTGPGGSHWVARFDDSTDELLRVAEENGELALRAGTRWFRDVGAPRRDGRALSLRVRDAWQGRRDRPYVRAAGTWIAKTDVLPSTICVEAADADELAIAVEQQIDDGADLVKLYLDGPDADTAPWTVHEVERVTSLAHARGVTVTAHATQLHGARSGVLGGVDCIEHGSRLDEELAAEMARRSTFVVPTLSVLASWLTFADTTTIERFTEPDNRRQIAERIDDAYASVAIAHRAGVSIAAGTDFGGGSVRANQMAWEVEHLVRAGLAPHDALASATWIGGDLLGEPEAGRVRAGGPADFFFVHGNPLDEPAALWRVWKVA